MDNTLFLRKITEAIPVGERTTSADFSILTNAQNINELQRIAFLDSRGRKIFPEENQNYIASLLAEEWARKNEKYLILTRTHASTTFFTLINFLNNLQVRIPYLITNAGFVDFTPKKKEVIEDIILQAKPFFGEQPLSLIEAGELTLSSGKTEKLMVLDMAVYIDEFASHLSHLCAKTVFIGTHEVSADTVFERERPASFYSQLQETNKFLKQLAQKLARPGLFFSPPEMTGRVQDTVFDGVHFTNLGHAFLFQKLLSENLI